MQDLEGILSSGDEFYQRGLFLNKRPYDANVDMIGTVIGLFNGRFSDDFKARRLFYWFYENMEYVKKTKYASASQTFRTRKGLCVNFAFLYNTMAKIAGLEAYFVLVSKDEDGKSIKHACSAVVLDGKLVLVDTSGCCFSPKYKEFRVINDDGVYDCYPKYFLKFNDEDFEAARNFFRDFIDSKYKPYINYESNYDYCSPEYIKFIVSKAGDRVPENNILKDYLGDLGSRVFINLLLRVFKYIGFPVLASSFIGILSNLDISDYYNIIKYPFVDYLYCDKREEPKVIVRDLNQEIRDWRPIRYQEMIEKLSNVYPDDFRLSLKYSENNYLIISRMHLEYIKSKLISSD